MARANPQQRFIGDCDAEGMAGHLPFTIAAR
jgi:hypothetical protein